MAVSDWEEAKDRVREAADIVQVIGEQVQLRRAGGNHFVGLCPFHAEKTPSFSVNPQRQMYKCFGCGESGDVFAFLMKHQNLSFPEALKELAKRYQISLPESKQNEAEQEKRRQRERLHQINAAAAQIFHDFLSEAQAKPAREYLRKRGVPQEFVEQYQLGYAPPQWNFLASRLIGTFQAEAVEQAGLICRRQQGGWYDRFRDRIMFPILDAGGKVCAFGGRILGDSQPKYMNSPESPVFSKGRVLFGLHQHREAIRTSRRAIVVEGNFDLLLLDVHGIGNTVAPLGTALTREHIKALRGYCQEAVLLFDGDAAGLRAAKRAVPLFLAEQMEAKVALLPAGHDPDSLVREQGKETAERLISDALPLPEFVFGALAREHGLTLTGKSRIMAELTELVQQAADRAQRELMAAHFAEKLGVAPALFGVGNAQAQQTWQEEPSPVERSVPAASAPLLGAQRQLLHFLIFYPELFNQLHAGGLVEYAQSCAGPVQAVIGAISRLSAAGPFVPEQLLAALPEGAARQHVAEMLLRGVETVQPDDEEVQENCAKLLSWLQAAQQQQVGTELLLRFRQAQEAGDSESVRLLTEQLLAARLEAAGRLLGEAQGRSRQEKTK